MNTISPIVKARKYVESHTKLQAGTTKKKYVKNGFCLTISRQCGINSQLITEELVNYFNLFRKNDTGEWATFDKNLIQKVLKDHELPTRLDKFIAEERMSTMNEMLNELFKVHPPIMKLFHKTSSTILKLAEMGNVIIVGRAANIITNQLKNTFHIRLVAPLKVRIKNIQSSEKTTKKEAEKIIEHEDNSRRAYVRRHFHKDIDNPYNYHVIINVDKYDTKTLVETIGQIVIRKFPKYFECKND